LTKHLSKDYTGYNYDFFLKEVEDLQKEGKVEIQLIAGKVYIQIKRHMPGFSFVFRPW